MIALSALTRLSPVLWEIPRTHRPDMRVPARVVASETLLADIRGDRSLEQLVNVATLPGIVNAALVMPDVHEGYGFPIGGVAATLHPDGVISPGGIGYDINCGVRLLLSTQPARALRDGLEGFGHELMRAIPSGVGRGGRHVLKVADLDRVLSEGIPWAVRNGFADEGDAARIESRGTLPQADPAHVSDHAKDRGRDQLGTMGAGNHFVEVARVTEVFDATIAGRFGLFDGQLCVLIHTGSRGLGHQVATDFIRRMMAAMPRQGIVIPDRELACARFSSPEGREYFAAMAAAANFAWVNRQLITHAVRESWQRTFGAGAGPLRLLYDVAHNIAKLEEHDVGGLSRRVIVHRKGATRAFGPGHPEIGEEFRDTGQPVLIPGSMGTASYVLAGAAGAMRLTFGSACHGAGRRMSRHAAKKLQAGPELRRELAARGIVIRSGSVGDLPEEAPYAYKDVHAVVDVVAQAGIARKVARLAPLVVVKG
jgi:tRNA-splicing ligase RtcB